MWRSGVGRALCAAAPPPPPPPLDSAPSLADVLGEELADEEARGDVALDTKLGIFKVTFAPPDPVVLLTARVKDERVTVRMNLNTCQRITNFDVSDSDGDGDGDDGADNVRRLPCVSARACLAGV